MTKDRKKARCRPPWWARAALYAAQWPLPEFWDSWCRLHVRYLRTLRMRGPIAARRYAKEEARSYVVAAAFRIVWGLITVWKVTR